MEEDQSDSDDEQSGNLVRTCLDGTLLNDNFCILLLQNGRAFETS